MCLRGKGIDKVFKIFLFMCVSACVYALFGERIVFWKVFIICLCPLFNICPSAICTPFKGHLSVIFLPLFIHLTPPDVFSIEEEEERLRH